MMWLLMPSGFMQTPFPLLVLSPLILCWFISLVIVLYCFARRSVRPNQRLQLTGDARG